MDANSMNLFRLWWVGVIAPHRAFEELRNKPAPAWGFLIVVVFNIMISLTTLLPQFLLGFKPMMKSWLTFLPTEKYFLPEMLFLPPLRVLVWILGSGITYLGLRLAKQKSDFDTLLNMGGLGYLIVMPFIFVSDWILIALNRYSIAEYSHPLAAVWSIVLTVIGLKTLFGIRPKLGFVVALLSEALSIPFLAIFAR